MGCPVRQHHANAGHAASPHKFESHVVCWGHAYTTHRFGAPTVSVPLDLMHISHLHIALGVSLTVPMHALEGLLTCSMSTAAHSGTAWFTSKSRCCLFSAAGCGTLGSTLHICRQHCRLQAVSIQATLHTGYGCVGQGKAVQAWIVLSKRCHCYQSDLLPSSDHAPSSPTSLLSSTCVSIALHAFAAGPTWRSTCCQPRWSVQCTCWARALGPCQALLLQPADQTW